MGMIKKEDIWANIGEIVAGIRDGRTSLDELTVFVSTGLAIQDSVVAELVYRKALENKIGRFIKI